MKKVTIVVLDRYREQALERLAGLGLVHLGHVRPPSGEPVEEIQSRIGRISRALEILPEGEGESGDPPPPDWEEFFERVVSLRDETSKRRERRQRLQARIDFWKYWGDFDPSLLARLRNRGVHVHLAAVPEKELSAVDPGVAVERLFKRGPTVYCVLVSDREREFPFETLPPPDRSLTEMRSAAEEEDRAIAAAHRELEKLSSRRPALERLLESSLSGLEFERARAGMGESGRLAYLRGFCPRDQLGRLEQAAAAAGWGLLVEDPGPDDRPPTLVTNPKFVSLIKPVLDFIDVVPGYREVDPSFVFLFFFSIFFAMLIGDAGYGAIFLAAAGLAHWRLGPRLKDKKPLFLLYLLAGTTVVWGVLTGTYFGQEWLPATVTGFVPWMRQDDNIIWLCFLVGAIQLTIAHSWRALRKAPDLTALADLGWICVIWMMYYVAGMFILGRQFPPAAFALGGLGVLLLVVFSIPPRRFFQELIPRNFALFLQIISSFADVVSYIRLFAVGLATVAIADAFNSMAAGLGWSNIAAGFGTAFILLFGHILNMILCGMAVLVHGVRLNVLEFSSHLGNEWSGERYRPFRATRLGSDPEVST